MTAPDRLPSHERLRVVGITSSTQSPAGRFRVRQFIHALAPFNIKLRDYHPTLGFPIAPYSRYGSTKAVIIARYLHVLFGKAPGLLASRAADVCFLTRGLISGVPTLESLIGKPMVLDVDDAVWLARPFGFHAAIHAARQASAVTAGNNFLADWYSNYNRRVELIPTSIDTERFRPAHTKDRRRFVIGWTGSSSTLPYLEGLDRPLASFLARHREAELLVVADRAPTFENIPHDRVRFVPWAPQTEVATVQEMDVGLMPLDDTEWSRGKCAFKMLQYLACGVPAIVSPIGANRDVLVQDDVGWGPRSLVEWADALDESYARDGTRLDKGRRGRSLVEREYSVRTSARKLAAIFRRVAP